MAAMLSRCGHFLDSYHSRRNFSALNEQRNMSRFCDVVLRICSTEIYAHANVLAAASPYFDSFLGTGNDSPRTFSQKHPQIIEIHIDNVMITDGDGGYGEAVSKVVDYMYTSEITLTTTLVPQIIEIGKIMLLDKLLEFCNQFQMGINDNKPCSVSTCTSGLLEVADLLSSRSRIIKRTNVSTETDEVLFAKLRSSPIPFVNDRSLQLQDISSRADDSASTTSHDHSLYSVNIVPDKYETPDFNMSEKVTSLSDVSGTPIFSTFEQSPLGISDLQNDPIAIKEFQNDPIKEIKEETESVVSCHPSNANKTSRKNGNAGLDSTIDSMDNYNAESFSEVLNVLSPKILPAPHDLTEKVNAQPETIDWPLEVQDVLPVSEAAESKSTSHTSFPSASLSSVRTTQPQRGFSRGRKRGRGKRGRPPGRPRKIKDPESDPDFEEFMEHLEKGENGKDEECKNKSVESQVKDRLDGDSDFSSVNVSDVSSKKEDPDYIPINVRRKSMPSHEVTWKSPRIRNKPSQLKKDYIFHSLSRKTRQPHGVSSHERMGVNKQASKSTANSNGSSGKTTSLQFVCQKCDFATCVFKDYRQHLRSHPETDPRYFVCTKCDFKTTKSREFTSHKQMHMTQELICTYCDYQAVSRPDYEGHLTKHDGEFPYFCTECDSKFKKKTQLMSHKPKHLLVKPFVCMLCGSAFKWKHALKNHMITHSTTKDHLCDVCGYATAHKSQLKAHKLVHTGQTFKCTTPGCHFEATNRQKLKYHMFTHTREKPHQCHICGQRFSLNKNMRRHMLLHSSFRPYACKMCSFTTTRYDKIKEHNFKLHNIGEAPVIKKVSLDFLDSNVTYHVSSENISLNPDGTFSEEALQKIAELTSTNPVDASDLPTVNIDQVPTDGSNFPVIAQVHYTPNEEVVLQTYIPEMTE